MKTNDNAENDVTETPAVTKSDTVAAEPTPASLDTTITPTPDPAPENGKPKRRLPLCAKIAGWGLFTTMLVVGGTVGTVALVPSIQHRLIQYGVSYVDGLTIETIDGSLVAPTFHGIHYTSPGIEVTLDQLTWDWDWREIAKREVALKKLQLAGIKAKITTSEIPPSTEPSEPVSRLTLPVSVTLTEGSLEDVDVTVDGNRVQVARLNTSVIAKKSLVDVDHLLIDTVAVTLANAKPLTTAAEGDAKEPDVSDLNDAATDTNATKASNQTTAQNADKPGAASAPTTNANDANPPTQPVAQETNAKPAVAVAEKGVLANASNAAAPMTRTEKTAEGNAKESAKENPKETTQATPQDADKPAIAKAPIKVKALVEELRERFGKPLVSRANLPAFPLAPLDVRVKKLDLQRVTVAYPSSVAESLGFTPPQLNRLTLVAELTEKALTVPHFAFELSEGTTALLSARYGNDAKVPVGVNAWLKPGKLLADVLKTPVEPVSSMTSLSLAVKGEVLGELHAGVELKGASPLTLNASTELATAGLPFKVELVADRFAMGPTTPEVQTLSLVAEGRFADTSSVAHLVDTTPRSADAKNTTSAPDGTTNAEASTQSKNRAATTTQNNPQTNTPANTPTNAQTPAPATSPEGESYRVTLRGKLVPPQTPETAHIKPMSVALNATGDLSHIQLTDTGLTSPDGTAVMEGELHWLRQLAGAIRLALVKFDVGVLTAAAPVRLGGEAEVTFSSASEDVLNTWMVELTRAKFTGALTRSLTSDATLKGETKGKTKRKTAQKAKKADPLLNGEAALKASARASAAGDWSADVSEFRWGDNTLKLQGKGRYKGGLSADAKVSLHLPNLEAFTPQVSGKIAGDVLIKGEITDTIANPVITSDLTLENIDVRGANQASLARIQSGALKGTFGVAKGATPLTLLLSHLTVGEDDDAGNNDPMRFSEIKAALSGTLARHQLALSVVDGPAPLKAIVTGALSRDFATWRGKLSDVAIQTQVGDVTTASLPIEANLKTAQVTLGAHCWENLATGRRGKVVIDTPNQVCLVKPVRVGPSGQATLSLKRFDLTSLSRFVDRDLTLEGIFTGDVKASWNTNAQGLPEVTATIENHGIRLVRQTDSGPLSAKFTSVTLNAKTTRQGITAQLAVVPENNGKLTAQVTLGDLAKRKTLAGTITLEPYSLGILNQLFTTGESVDGKAVANLKLGGTLESPLVTGELKLQGIDVRDGLVPLKIEPSDITLLFHGNRSTLDGVVRTNEGELAITGSADWSNMADPQAKVHVVTRRDGRDETMGLTIPPYAQLEMGADVTVMASNAGIDVTGEVVIPKGQITVKELPDSAIQPSSDLVMLKRDLTPITPKSAGMPIRSSLKITIGPRLLVDAFNLKARLEGVLSMRQTNQGLGLNGSVNLRNGSFFAYGQALNITKGEILFSGPLDNPYLNLEAIRDPNATEDNVTAGLRVRGSASQPKVTIFSTPALSQEEALSYLLRGQGLGSTGNDGQAVASALLGMGLSQTSGIVGDIGKAFGIRDLQVTSEGVGNKTKVVVKGNLLPRLQLKYGVGVFDSLATFTLRYRLLPRLYLQGIWDDDTTLDLLYRWEWN